MAEWKREDVIRLIKAGDFSRETDLKRRLIKQICPVKKITYDELGERIGKTAAPEKETRGRSSAEKSHTNDRVRNGVLNNDRPVLPERFM